MKENLKSAISAYKNEKNDKEFRSFRPDTKLVAFFNTLFKINQVKAVTVDWEILGAGGMKKVLFQKAPKGIRGNYLKVEKHSGKPFDSDEYEEVYNKLKEVGLPTFETLDKKVPAVLGPNNPYSIDTEGNLYVFDQRLLDKDIIIFSFGGDQDDTNLELFYEITIDKKDQILRSAKQQLEKIVDIASANNIEIMGHDCYTIVYNNTKKELLIKLFDFDFTNILENNRSQEAKDKTREINNISSKVFLNKLSSLYSDMEDDLY